MGQHLRRIVGLLTEKKKTDGQFSLFFTSDLSRNKLSELPAECTDFASLEKLILYHNSIRAIPETVVCLQSLQFLDLR